MPVQMFHFKNDRGTYFAELGGPAVRIFRDGEQVATAPQQHGKSGNYMVTMNDGTLAGSTNWLASVVAIAAEADTHRTYAVTIRTGTGETSITCSGPNEAAQLALTLACDGWTAKLDADSLAWVDDPQNFDTANAATIRRAQA